MDQRARPGCRHGSLRAVVRAAWLFFCGCQRRSNTGRYFSRVSHYPRLRLLSVFFFDNSRSETFDKLRFEEEEGEEKEKQGLL